MDRNSRITAALVVVATALAGVGQAQSSRPHVGPRISYQFDLEEVGLGVQFGAPIARNVEFYPSFDYFFVENGTFWNLNADLKFRLASASVQWLYLGAGLNLARRGSGNAHDTSAGMNVLAGIESLKGRVHPFGEFRFTANDGSTGQLAVGFNFVMGRR